jgi:hypothetical protein
LPVHPANKASANTSAAAKAIVFFKFFYMINLWVIIWI